MIGTRLSRYEITARLGAGGMGEVYAAEDMKLNRRVALKILPSEIADHPDRLERFEREAQALAALSHPSIVTIHSVEEADGVHFLTMELIEGRTLAEIIPADGMDREPFFTIARPLASALTAAHERGVTHRDLKPANIMVTDAAEVKILDFGLAKLTGEPSEDEAIQLPTAALTDEGMVLGTVPYMSPEQVTGQPVDHRTDIFSLGILFYEMVTGRRPFEGKNSVTLSGAIVHLEPPRVSEIRADLPNHMGRIVRRCLEKDPDRRYQTARDVRNDLDRFMDDLQTGRLSTIGTTVKIEPPAPAKRRWLPAVGVVGGVGLLGLVAWLVVGRGTIDEMPVTRDLVDNRVIVAPFENRTSDPTFDGLGVRIGDVLTAALSSIQLEVDPIGWETMRELEIRAPRGLPSGPNEGERVRSLAQATGSRYVVSGTIYPRDAGLSLAWRMTDAAEGGVLWSAEVPAEFRSDPAEAIKELVQRVKGFTASSVAWEKFSLDRWRAFQNRPPRYDAYRETQAAWQTFTEGDKVLEHCERAIEIDPEFVRPYFMLRDALMNRGRWKEVDEITDYWVERIDELPLGYRLRLQGMLAREAGNRPKAHEYGVRLAELSLYPPAVFLAQSGGVGLNRPQWVIDSFPEVSLWTFWWHYLVKSDAHHLLGNHEEELALARENREHWPEYITGWRGEIGSLAARGRIAELERAFDEIDRSSLLGNRGRLYLYAAATLRAHGYRDDSLGIAGRGIDWFLDQPEDEASGFGTQEALADGLYLAERWEESGEIYQQLLARSIQMLADDPQRADQNTRRVTLMQGRLGCVAARLGKLEEARSWFEMLAVEREDIGQNTLAAYERARIAALLGDAQTAIDLARQAYGAGRSFGPGERHNMDFESLWGSEPWEELMRPKG